MKNLLMHLVLLLRIILQCQIKKLLETSNSQAFQQFTLDINVAYRLMGFKGNILCIGIKSILKNCKNLPGIFDGFLGGYFGE